MDKQIPLSPAHLAQALSGKRILEEEAPIPAACFQLLRSSKQVIPVPAIDNKKGSLVCTRCGNTSMRFFSEYPCGICRKKHFYCRNCIQMGRISECKPLYIWNGEEAKWPAHPDPLTWEGELTTAQSKAAVRLANAVTEKLPSYLCWAVCGSGKTEMLYPAITAALKRGNRVALASPRVDVIRELYPRIKKAFQDVSLEALYGGSEQRTGKAQLILATTHQLMRYHQAFDLLIIDEVDAFPYYTDKSLLHASKQAVKKQATTLYLTATPRKNFRIQMKLRKLPYVFVPLRYHGHPLPVPDFQFAFSLSRQLANKTLPKSFFKWLTRRANPKRQLLIFVPEIEMAKQLQAAIADVFLHTGVISAAKEFEVVFAADHHRETKINQFREKKLRALVTTTILERGVTFPSVDVAVLAAGHTVFNEAALVQIAGRAGRSADDPSGEVRFFHDGKTNAMEKAKQMIVDMNQRGRKL